MWIYQANLIYYVNLPGKGGHTLAADLAGKDPKWCSCHSLIIWIPFVSSRLLSNLLLYRSSRGSAQNYVDIIKNQFEFHAKPPHQQPVVICLAVWLGRQFIRTMSLWIAAAPSVTLTHSHTYTHTPRYCVYSHPKHSHVRTHTYTSLPGYKQVRSDFKRWHTSPC